MSLQDQLGNLRNKLGQLIDLHNNPFDTSGFSGNGVIEQIQNLQQRLGNVATGNGGSTGSISGSVGRGGTNNSADVRTVQTLLNRRGAGLTVDGDYGNKTYAAIVNFQRTLGFQNPDGLIEVGGQTWQALSRGGRNNGNSSGGRGELSGSVGRGGANNTADVRTVQTLLNRKGASIGVDGQIGNQTISAINAFQSANGISPDGLIEPGKNTWKKLTGDGASIGSGNNNGGSSNPPQPQPSRPTGSYTYYTHPNWQNVSIPLQAGSRTAKPLNAHAERLLRSVIAKAGLSGLTVTSTKRDYTDQAYITLTQVTVSEALRWYPYAAGNQTLFYRYRNELAQGRDRETVFREYGDYIRRVAGEGASNHIPGYAIDVSGPGLAQFNAAAQSLVPIRGSGVRTIFPETGRSHIEFTFIVV